MISLRILQNNTLLQRQSENYIKGELSNVAMVIQSGTVLVDYYSIDADSSTTVTGTNNVDNFIGKDSPVVYDKIEKLPIGGIDNLLATVEYSDDLGHDVDFSSQGIIFPNTITPKPGDFFRVYGGQIQCLFVVTNFSQVAVRSNPFIEINFRLYTQSKELFQQLEKQVRDTYIVTVTSLGNDKTLVMKKSTYFTIQDHMKNYMELVDMYISLFYDRRKSTFCYQEFFDQDADLPAVLVDFILLAFLYHSNTIVYDNAITYAINNLNVKHDRVYIDDPSTYIDNYEYKKSPLYRILDRNPRTPIDEFPYIIIMTEDVQRTMRTGINLYFAEKYDNTCGCNTTVGNFTIWDAEFLDRIKNDIPYTADDYNEERPKGFNILLRNAIIDYYHNREIDFDNLTIEHSRSFDNFSLIPIVLFMYKQYILSKS